MRGDLKGVFGGGWVGAGWAPAFEAVFYRALQLSVLAEEAVIVLVAPHRRQRAVLLDINWAFIMCLHPEASAVDSYIYIDS